MAPTTALINQSDNNVKYLEISVFIFWSFINTILIQFKFEKKKEKHLLAYVKYSDIVYDIEYQLLKPEIYRENVNLFCSKIKTKYMYLNRSTFII